VIAELELAVPLAIACLAISAFCAGTEVALFSIRRLERGQLAQSPRLVDRRIVALLERPRRLTATVLIGMQACNAVLAVLAFAVLLQRFAVWPALWLAIAVALPLIVLGTEITAKTLAAKAPLAWARLCVLPLIGFELITAPARLVVQAATAVVLAPFGGAARPRPAHDLSEEEFRTLVDAGSVQGQVDARERRLIHRVFEFNDKNVGQVMTPRDRIFALSYDLPAQRLVKEVAARGFSRVPIYQRSLDNIRGIVNAKDLVRVAAGQPLGRPLGELLHEPLFVPRTTPVKRLFLTFKQKKVHMAIVVSEYGKVLGLVTMDDLLAQIFGVLRDERAALQSSMPPGGSGTAGRPALRLDGGGAVIDDGGAAGASGAPIEIDGGTASHDSGPAPQPGVLDPPPPRVAYSEDEVTPPAIDLDQLTPPEPTAEASGAMPRARRLSSQAENRRRARTLTPPADDLAPAAAAAVDAATPREGKS
jgi:CBS domain containing-hemolysin-like protein